MKTGRLLKFHRSGAEVHAYLYHQEPGGYRAALYVRTADGKNPDEPLESLAAASEAALEAEVRAWIDHRFP